MYIIGLRIRKIYLLECGRVIKIKETCLMPTLPVDTTEPQSRE